MTKLVPSLACLAATLVVSSAFVAGPHRRPLPRLAQQLGDDQQYEADRLRQDEQARAAMRAEAERQYADLRTPWNWVIRKRVWDELEARDIARPPRPVHHRIPNFDGAAEAAARLVKLDEFERAALVKVNPDTPQKAVRRAVLERGKTLLTPQPRLRTGFFSTVTLADVPDGKLAEATTSRGVAKYGAGVSLEDAYTVDLVVVGSTAVCPATGARVGKGEGFAELEWGILTEMGNLDAREVLVVTSVHDAQVVDDIPRGALTKHDVPVDIIVTPTRVIRVAERLAKPSGIYWDLLSPEKLGSIRVLRELKRRIEAETGAKLPEAASEKLPPTAERSGRPRRSGKSPKSTARPSPRAS